MCRSRAEGGRRCQGSGTHASHQRGPGPAAAGAPDASSAGRRLASEIEGVSQHLERAAAEGRGAQGALEQVVTRIRGAYTATAAQTGGLSDQERGLREDMLSLASRIDRGLDDELTSRGALLDSAMTEAGALAERAHPKGRPAASASAAANDDGVAYLGRVAELDRRVAGGENIDEIMQGEQRARNEEQVRQVVAQGW